MNFESSKQTAVFIQSSLVLPRRGGGFGMTKNYPGGGFVPCLFPFEVDITHRVPQGVEVHDKVLRLWIPVPGETFLC